jgi:hypothetical protein
VCAEEAGDSYNQAHRSDAARHQDYVFDALVGLHSRACRTALEVHHLLSGGFPQGALARCRTLHELAVTAIVLGDHGRGTTHSDVAERFVLHERAVNYNEALVYQQNCAFLGTEPFSEEAMTVMADERKALIDRFGSKFSKSYGWAADVTGNPQPNFEDVQKVAELSHLRGYYKLATHEVHSDAKGLTLNRFDRNGVAFLSTGRSNSGLAEPGHLALISLHQCTTLLLIRGSGEIPDPMDLTILAATKLLLDDAGLAFANGQESVDRAEAAYLASPDEDDPESR